MRLLCSLSVCAHAPTDALRLRLQHAAAPRCFAQPTERAGRTRGPAERRSRVRQVGTPCTDRGHPGSETRGSDRAGMPSLGVRGAVVGELGVEVLRQLVFEMCLLFAGLQEVCGDRTPPATLTRRRRQRGWRLPGCAPLFRLTCATPRKHKARKAELHITRGCSPTLLDNRHDVRLCLGPRHLLWGRITAKAPHSRNLGVGQPEIERVERAIEDTKLLASRLAAIEPKKMQNRRAHRWEHG